MRTPSPQNKQNLLLTSTQYTNQLILNKIKATEFFHYSPFTSTQPQLFKEGSPIFIRDKHSFCFLVYEKDRTCAYIRIYSDVWANASWPNGQNNINTKLSFSTSILYFPAVPANGGKDLLSWKPDRSQRSAVGGFATGGWEPKKFLTLDMYYS